MTITSFAQVNVETMKANDAKKFAQSALRFGNTELAIKMYTRYFKLKPKDADVALILGDLNREIRHYNEAMNWYLTSYTVDKKNVEALYNYAIMNKMNGNYDLAQEMFEKFAKEGKKTAFYKKMKKQYQLDLKGIEFADLKTSYNVEIKRLNETINKEFSEFSPILLNDTSFIFTSYGDNENDKNFTRFYTAKLNGKTWEKEKMMFETILNEEKNYGNGCFSSDKKRFYFTIFENNFLDKPISHIYVSVNKNGTWEKPVKLGNKVNLLNYTSTQPTLTTNSKGFDLIYFVSDRPNGRGGKDIWYTEFDAKLNEFKEPQNAGRKINSTADERTPFMDNAQNVLYFSSNGFPGLGGQDVFKTQGEKRKWTEPENLKSPINSPTDDTYFSINEKNNQGFVVSNRIDEKSGKTETCCDDIFSFNITNLRKFQLKGNVYFIDNQALFSELKKNKLIDNMYKNLTVSIYLKDEEEPIFVQRDSIDENGNFSFLIDFDKKYFIKIDDENSENFEFTTSENDTNFTASVGIYGGNVQAFTLNEIYYSFDQATLTADAKQILDERLIPFLQNNPQISIEIISHTDNLGTPDYNSTLSQQRAKSVVNYLVSNGIQYNRLVAVGKGENEPIAMNLNPDGSDNPNGREKNRRTELKIIDNSDLGFYADNKIGK